MKLRPSQAEFNARCETVARWYERQGKVKDAAEVRKLKVKPKP